MGLDTSTVEGDKYGILPALPNLAFAYSHAQIIAPKNMFNIVVLTALSIWLLVQGLIVIVNPGTFSPLGLLHIFLVASAGNPYTESDTSMTIPSAAIGDKNTNTAPLLSRRPNDFTTPILVHSWGGCGRLLLNHWVRGEFKKDENDCETG